MFLSLAQKFAKNTFSRILKNVAWEVVGLRQCRISFWIPLTYVFKWCKYEDHAPNSWWEICFQTKKSLIFFQPQGNILKGIFEAQFPNLLEILLKFYWKFYWKFYRKFYWKFYRKFYQKFYWTIYCIKYVVIFPLKY